MNAMFEGDLSPSRSANKGYAASFLEWVVDAKQIGEQGGPCDVDASDNTLPVVNQLWPMAQKIISESVKLAMPLLLLFGTENDSLSPFCKEFTTVQDLLQTYIEYCPKHFHMMDKGGPLMLNQVCT
jgi:hypothetical protein